MADVIGTKPSQRWRRYVDLHEMPGAARVGFVAGSSPTTRVFGFWRGACVEHRRPFVAFEGSSHAGPATVRFDLHTMTDSGWTPAITRARAAAIDARVNPLLTANHGQSRRADDGPRWGASWNVEREAAATFAAWLSRSM